MLRELSDPGECVCEPGSDGLQDVVHFSAQSLWFVVRFTEPAPVLSCTLLEKRDVSATALNLSGCLGYRTYLEIFDPMAV